MNLPTREMQRHLERGDTTRPVNVTPRQPDAFRTLTRQFLKGQAKAELDVATRNVKRNIRRARQKARLERQSKREKSGFYEGTMPVASVLGQRFGRFGRQVSDKTGKLLRLR